MRDGFFVTGSTHNPIYLLNSEKPILIEGGISLLGEVYRRVIWVSKKRFAWSHSKEVNICGDASLSASAK